MLVEHLVVFHGFTKARTPDAKTMRKIAGRWPQRSLLCQRPAILPWSSGLEWRPSFRWYGHLTRHRPAAGLLLDTLFLGVICLQKAHFVFCRSHTWRGHSVHASSAQGCARTLLNGGYCASPAEPCNAPR